VDIDQFIADADPAGRVVLDAPESPAAERLFCAITQGVRSREGRRRVRTVAAVGAGVVAAGLAAAVTLALLPGAPAAKREPAAVLLADIAAIASRQHPSSLRPGQYLYSERVVTSSFGVGRPGPHPYARCTLVEQVWLTRDAMARSQVTPVTGAPRACTPIAREQTARFAPGSVLGKVEYGAGHSFVEGLPRNPQLAARVLRRRYERAPAGSRLILVGQIGTLLEESLSPPLRSALYDLLASLPGISDLGAVTDQFGRHGIAFGVSFVPPFRTEFVIDPATAELLEEFTMTLPAGAVNTMILCVITGVVRSESATPSGAAVHSLIAGSPAGR
jgi:hypothetical protein